MSSSILHYSLFSLSFLLIACSPPPQAQQESPFLQENSIQLASPVLETGSTLFRDSVRVELALGMEGAACFYQVGKDEIKAYEGPFWIKESCEIQALARAADWLESEPAIAVFKRAGLQVAKAFLESAPSSSYPGDGVSTLIDGKKGSLNFHDGKWLGFDGGSMVALLDMETPINAEALTVSILSDPGSWIFPPKRIEVQASGDGKQYVKIAEKDYPTPASTATGGLEYLELKLETTQARYFKVTVEGLGLVPDWHLGAAQKGKAWLFVDEVILEIAE